MGHDPVSVRRSLLLRAGVGVALLGLAFLVDRAAFSVLRTGVLYDHSGEIREGLTMAKFLGSGLGTLVVGLVVGLVDPQRWRRAAVLWMVVVAAGFSAAVLKTAAGRERPSHLDQPVGRERIAFHGPAVGLRRAPFQSFPSGHTAGAFASATTLAAFYPPARVVFFCVATASGVNRIVKHQHFLSDVVAGALLGHLVALWLLSRQRVRRWWADPGSR